MKKIMSFAALPLLALSPAFATVPPTPPDPAAALRDAALHGDDLAWDITEGLTTEVGQRLAGTEAEARARDWAVRRLTELGFSNVHIEPFDMPVWVRGAEHAEIIAPFPQSLVVTALGNSGATPAEGIEARVVGFNSVEELEAAPDEIVRGRIVFINHAMAPTQDGSGYGVFGAPRRQGPTVASRKGAVAIVVRSVGTDHHRNPHTGVQTFGDGARPIPAGALSVPDAEQLQRILDRGREVRMRLTLTPRFTGTHPSGNVVADLPGSDPSAGMIIVGGHLDSWDLGTGAIDDASGVAIVTAAAHRIMQAGQPRRTIRIVWFGAEEQGGLGGRALFEAHHGRDHVVAVGESDFGADHVWRVQHNLAPQNEALGARIRALLMPLGIVPGAGRASAGEDLGPWARAGVAAIDLDQDGTRYFDYHHSPDDTLDKIDPAQLRQNVAAWTAWLAVLANAPEEIGGVPPVGGGE
ncbi:M20/M25/M40 family metallo-hydrolase [Sphingosinicella ginsenosidimutans]|uniref:Carboxypeptidase Q n=1 Tax=Allosphingosinicella ginsenosidimutans TaxID=1176539 RepID=A0A5C6TXM2_9SPHN|nr:M20/M25/M40 family metallo-hydrolase [Sphingosinicella ginsenosidimutans]TXC64641.1 M20/M25/M40 family metallo-hydrolase [Sphingosinicella ginsenosidimutans]